MIKKLVTHPIDTFRALVFRTNPLFEPASPDVILNAYTQTLNHPEYQAILKNPQLRLVTGIYDDHDFGVNDVSTYDVVIFYLPHFGAL